MAGSFDILRAGVRDIAVAIATGELTPDEIADGVIHRIEQVEPLVQAFSQIDLDLVRDQAATLTAEAARGDLRGPLHGVPVGIKEWFDVEGFPTLLHGLDTPPAAADAGVVAALRAAGAIIVGKTHVPIDDVPPPTRNPWNLEHTAGGSSSGSGAAVAARMVPATLGEQTTGSNIRPAAFCGIGALKPSYGLTSRLGMFPGAWSRDHPGIMGLTMADIAVILEVLVDADRDDPTISATPEPAPHDDGEPPTIGLVRNFLPDLTEPVMREAVERAATRLADAGAKVVDVALPDDFGAVWDAMELGRAETATYLARRRATAASVSMADIDRPGVASVRGVRREAELIPATFYVQARRVRHWLTVQLTRLLREQGLDALLTAAAPGPAPAGLTTTGSQALASPWSFLGFPAACINGGLSPEGLPLGLQLLDTPRRDFALLKVGGWCENVLGTLPAPDVGAR